MIPGKFERDELMMIACPPRGGQRFVGNSVVTRVAREIITPRLTLRANCPATFKVQAKFQAARMKTAAPVQCSPGLEIVPLNTQTESVEIAVKLTPTGGEALPCAVLGVRC